MLALGIYAVALLVGAVSFMLGGLGGTEAVMTLSLIAFGTDQSTAIAAHVLKATSVDVKYTTPMSKGENSNTKGAS